MTLAEMAAYRQPSPTQVCPLCGARAALRCGRFVEHYTDGASVECSAEIRVTSSAGGAAGAVVMLSGVLARLQEPQQPSTLDLLVGSGAFAPRPPERAVCAFTAEYLGRSVIGELAAVWWLPDAVHEALAERARKGRETYGTDLHPDDNRLTVADFGQETLDAVMYGTKRRMEVHDLRRRLLWALLVVNQAIVTWIAGRWG